MIVERGPGDLFAYLTREDMLFLMEQFARVMRKDGPRNFHMRPARFMGKAYPYLRISLVDDQTHADYLDSIPYEE